MNKTPSKWPKRLVVIGVMVLIAGAGGAAYIFNVPILGFNGAKPTPVAPEESKPSKVALVGPHTLSIPLEVRKAVGIYKNGKDNLVAAITPQYKRPLVLSASTQFDPGNLYRIRARFAPAKVVEITNIDDVPSGPTRYRELRPGDEVEANAPLAVFYSTDVAQKKNDLIDALVQYKLDKQVLDLSTPGQGAIPEVLRLNLVQRVQTDINAIDRARKVLELWEIPPEDIKEVYEEAKQRAKSGDIRDFQDYDIPKDKGADKAKDEKWGKVIVRAPAKGKIVERSFSLNELIVDPNLNLFQIARADKLMVLANAPEETVKELSLEMQKAPARSLKWTIHTLGDPDGDGISGTVDEIGMIVDPNQHTVPVKGLIDNKGKLLRAGQYVTATIELPAPDNVVEIPASAISDDGKQAVVFVDVGGDKFEMRRVMVTGRLDTRALVRSELSENEAKLTPEEKEQELLPKKPLKVGERVITSGLINLKNELEDLESKKAEEPKKEEPKKTE